MASWGGGGGCHFGIRRHKEEVDFWLSVKFGSFGLAVLNRLVATHRGPILPFRWNLDKKTHSESIELLFEFEIYEWSVLGLQVAMIPTYAYDAQHGPYKYVGL